MVVASWNLGEERAVEGEGRGVSVCVCVGGEGGGGRSRGLPRREQAQARLSPRTLCSYFRGI